MQVVVLISMAAVCAAAPAQFSPYAPPINLWFLSPSDVAGLITRIPLSHYREVSPNAPVAARTSYPSPQRGLRREEVEVSQFHAQDGAGRAVFGYNTGEQVRVEARSSDGRVRGSYSYRDPTGKIVKVQYWDDGEGFHAAGNSLPSESDVPEPVTETPEVAAARQRHETLHAQALQAALLAGNGEESKDTDQARVEGGGGASDLPPVYDEDGTELRRYPAPHHASLYDPSHLHDADRDAVVINNPDLEPDSFSDIQFFRSLGYRGRRAAAVEQSDQQAFQDDQHNGFFYSFRYPAPLFVGVEPDAAAQDLPLSTSQRAVFFDAIPVDAVHDTQVSPLQSSYSSYSRKPVYAQPQIA